MRQDDSRSPDRPAAGSIPGPDAPLVQQLQQGDPEAGRQLVREYYSGVYRYLLFLTGRREAAEDLTQETFLQAWRRLETFDNRGPLRPWLHRIAHREFLQALRSRHAEASLEELPETLAPHAGDPAEAVELRAVMTRLPLEEREALALHYLEGYSYQEIARIVGVPVTTVNYRLLEARARLRRELGEGDLPYLNPAPEAVLRHWAWLPLEALTALAARLSLGSEPWLNDAPEASRKGKRRMSDHNPAGMSRRKLLETAGTAAAAAAAASLTGPAAAAMTQNEAEIMDDRLTCKVTLAVKATALSDLCAQLHRDTRIAISAGPSVADEKVTVFCEKLPLREVMRQLSRPFGYTWLRSGSVLGVRSSVFGSASAPNTQHRTPNTEYRYELVQDLRSQLLEEELRNRDRNAALLVLEQEIQRYRPYLDLSPDEALARAKTAPAEEKPLLEQLGRSGWGPVQIYFRLTPPQLTALRDGEELRFSQAPKPGELPLPGDVARGVLPSLRDVFFSRFPDGFGISTGVKEPKEGDLPPTAVPEARANLGLSIRQTELGRIALQYWAGSFSQSDLPRNSGGATWEGDGALAVGISPAATQPDNRRVNARLARDPALQRRVSVVPEGTCEDRYSVFGVRPGNRTSEGRTPNTEPPTPNPRVTSAGVLEALHHATGLPLVADFSTHLYSPESLAAHDQPLFDALNRLADTLRGRWNRDGDWLEFRSASYYDDRLKEVPNRLLTRWSAARRQHGFLTLDDLCEIVQLSDAQLDADGMAEGARACWGLAEWRLAHHGNLRRHLRFLAELSPAQRQEAMSPAGLALAKMSLSQQQRYIALALYFSDEPLQSLEELNGAMMRVVYTQPGGFEWVPPGPNWYQWVVPVVPGKEGTRAVMPVVVAPTRDAALAAARRLDSRLLELILPEARRLHPPCETASQVPEAGEIKRTDLDLRIIYVPGLSSRRNLHFVSTDSDFHNSSW